MNCGVRLADTESRCPLCQTRAYHPDLSVSREPSLYPADRLPSHRHSKGSPIVLTALSALALSTFLVCDLQMHRAITWSGFAVGALLVFYTAFALPLWFAKPNPVIFVPCSSGVVTMYLMYIALQTGGNWFFPFALPVTIGTALLCTALITLLRYVRRGKLFTVGGCILAAGVFMLPVELLLCKTTSSVFSGWCFYPLSALSLLGGFLIFLGICRPAREAMTRKFFF